MGTRADFWLGRGEKAEWLGSIAWDGHPENFLDLAKTKTPEAFRVAVATLLGERDDGTVPADGWPWPWTDSHLTDYSYAFDVGRVYRTEHVREVLPCPNCKHGKNKAWVLLGTNPETDDDGYLPARPEYGVASFPDMTSLKRVAEPGTARSGVMVLRGPR